MKPSPRGSISCRKAMCPPWAVSNRATLGSAWTVFSGNAGGGKGEKYRLKHGWETWRILARNKSHHPPVICFCIWLTMMRREGVIGSVEAQDGHCGCGEFFVWTRVMVIIYTGSVTKLQRSEAFIKLADCPRLEEKKRLKFQKRSNDGAEAEKNEEPSRRIRTAKT